MSSYRIAVNLEWTSKCNARCVMCPREAIAKPQLMRQETLDLALGRITPGDVFRVVIAGYGEPTTHPRFAAFIDALRAHPVPFDMVSNGHQIDAERLRHLDGAIRTLVISFSSVDPDVYRRVHVGLDQQRVMANIVMAQKILKKTGLAISLTPMADCLSTLPDTIAWLRASGIERLTMSPSLYDRAGQLGVSKPSSGTLRNTIKRCGLRSQEFDFIGGIGDFLGQWRTNGFKCVPRNSDMLIGADGRYLYCFNDITHSHPLGHVADISLREALHIRELLGPDDHTCSKCSIRQRYGGKEIVRVALSYLRERVLM